MANKKISELTDGTPPQSIDEIPIARSGTNYRISVADLNPLQLLQAQATLTPTDLYALSGGTKVLVTGVTGKIIVPFIIQLDKAAGTAYTLNSVSRINVCQTTGSGLVLAYSLTANFMDSTGAKSDYCVHPGSATGGYTATLTASGTGQSLVAGRLGGTDLSAGTGDLIVTTFYYLISVPASLTY